MEIPPKKPHFFKPILPSFKNGLKIPIGFLKYLKGHDDIEHAILRRGGKKWLVKANGRRLEEGDWKEFVEELNLELGDILVFKHEGKMEFEVSVFDSSHCDREYVEYMQMEEEEGEDMKDEDNKEQDDHEDEEEDELDVEEDEEEDEEEEEEDMVDEDEDDENDEDEDEDDEDEDEDEDEDDEDEDEYEDENDEDTDEEGEEAATHDKPLGQSHFECTIRQYCLSRDFMWIPKHFASANGLIKGNKKCGLIIIDERKTRSWNLMLTSNKTQVRINGDGWRKFSADNYLKEGDHTMFEIVTNGETPIWKFRVVMDVETPTRKFQDKPKAKIKTSGKAFSNVEAAKDMHLSDHSHFICTIKHYCLSKHFLCVPKQFARENRLENRKCKIIMKDEQRSWTFNMYTSSQITYFGNGWREFSNTKCLKEGDRLMFEIVSNGETPIFRFHDLRGSPSIQPEVKKKKSDAERMSLDKGLERKNLGATTLKSQLASSTSVDANSHFISTIKPYTISNPVLYLPLDFVKSNGLMRRREMILVDGKQRSWSVCIGQKGRHHFGIKRGWTQFRNANGLQVGDTYKFELTNNGTIPIVHFHYLRGSPSVDVNSHFISTIKPYNISKSVLYLPLDFVKSNGLMHRREMILVDGKQRSWSVCVGRMDCHHFGVKSGWTQFRNANGVQVGDTYKFELINNGTIPIVHFHCKYSGN